MAETLETDDEKIAWLMDPARTFPEIHARMLGEKVWSPWYFGRVGKVFQDRFKQLRKPAEQLMENRYLVERGRGWQWVVRISGGLRTPFHYYRRAKAVDAAKELHRAFLDGRFAEAHKNDPPMAVPEDLISVQETFGQ